MGGLSPQYTPFISIGEITYYLLTIDPKFLGHPSTPPQKSSPGSLMIRASEKPIEVSLNFRPAIIKPLPSLKLTGRP